MAQIREITLFGTDPSEVIDLHRKTITRIQIVGSWDISDLLFQEAYEPTDTYRPLYDELGDRVRIVAGADRMIAVDARRFQSARLVKFQSSASQDNPRTLRVTVQNLAELVYTGGGNNGVAL